jgi:hypothetical protein
VTSGCAGLLTSLLPLLAAPSGRGPALLLLVTLMARYPGSCGAARPRLEAAFLELLGAGVGPALLGKAWALLPQLGGGGKEGAEHTARHAGLVAGMLGALHAGLDTLLQHVRELQPVRKETVPALVLPLRQVIGLLILPLILVPHLAPQGPSLQRAAGLSAQLEDLMVALGALLTRGFPAPRLLPVDGLLALASRLLSLPALPPADPALALLLPRLAAAALGLVTDLVTAAGDLLLPEAASLTALLVSGLARVDSGLPVRTALHRLLIAWCQGLGAASGQATNPICFT